MAGGFGHLIGAHGLGKAVSYFRDLTIRQLEWLFLLLGGILPDCDFLLQWTIGWDVHRTFTHSIAFVIVMSTLLYWIVRLFCQHLARPSIAASMLALGILSHLFLDSVVDPSGIQLLWPLVLKISLWGIHSLATSDLFNEPYTLHFMLIDTALGVIWLFYLTAIQKLKW